MNSRFLSTVVAVSAATAVSLLACSRDEVANRKAPSEAARVSAAAVAAATPAAPAAPVASAGAAVGMRLGFGVTCTADAECGTGTCFRKGATGGGGGADNGEGSGGGGGGNTGSAAKAPAPHAGGSAADAEKLAGYCSMPCNGNSDCPVPLTGGKCNGRGFCKKG